MISSIILLTILGIGINQALKWDEFKPYLSKIKLGYGIFAFLVIVSNIYSHFIMVQPGTVGVLVNLFGDKKGVDDQELTVGMHFIPPWKQTYIFPIYEQNHIWEGSEGFIFQTAEGLSVQANIGITFHLSPDKIHTLFCKYRKGMDEITHIFIKNNLRDAINRLSSKMKIEDLVGSQKEVFFDHVQELVRHDLEEIGMIINRVYLIGNFHLPDRVVEALNQKIEAIQRAQQRENELREAEAQAKKEVAKIEGEARGAIIEAEAKARSAVLAAEAEAKKIDLQSVSQANANKRISESLTKDLIQYMSIQQWNGKLPHIVGGDNMMIPFNPGIGK